MTSIMSNRVVGQLPLSVPTSLALEAAIGIHPDYKVNKEPILKYDEFWINITTLFRNMHSSIEKESIDKVTPIMYADALDEEMTFIEELIKERSNNSVKVKFYYSNYQHIELHYKQAVVRMDNTDKQKDYTALRNKVIRIILERHKENPTHHIYVFGLHIKHRGDVKKKVMLLTHYAIDLLTDAFSHITLLESHTGKIKEKAQWYTKFEDKDLAQIPFADWSIQIFGDKEIFRPLALSLRKDILEVAKKYNWSSITTHAKVLYGVESMKNQYAKEILKSII